MPLTQHQKQFAPFDLSALPTEEAFRVQMSDQDYRTLIIFLLDQIGGGGGGGGGSSAARTPVPTSHAVDDTVDTLATLAEGRVVLVYNNGPDDVTLSFGAVNAVFGAGVVTLEAGDGYETPREVIGKVTAITDAGGSAALTMTLF